MCRYYLSLSNLSDLGHYTPPPCDFNRVTINFTVTSQGRQFDRLALLYLGDVEVFRTSTAEPTRDGIVWTYIKEMYHYGPLWKKEQKIIFDLGNLVNEIYTGTFNTTLTATFYTASDTPAIADIILPISAQRSSEGQGSAFSVPSQHAIIVHEFPLNVEKAVVSLAACGQDREEFWYTNVLSSRTETFGHKAGPLNGYSPFREVQLLIDGQLAGVSWPFPVIFTGGIVPGLWRPIVGIDAFDLREHEIDITPFVPLLCDGNPHVFQIQVVGLKEDGVDHATLSETVGSSWVVSGKIFLFLNKEGHHTTGFAPILSTAPPVVEISSRITTNPHDNANETLVVNTEVNRHIFITNVIATPTGYRESWWRQVLFFSNFNKFTGQGSVQFTSQSTIGLDESKSDYTSHYTYPLTIHSSFSVDEKHVQIDATLSRGLDFTDVGPSVFPPGYRSLNRSSSLPPPDSHKRIPNYSGGHLSTTQGGHARYFASKNQSYSFGTTQQDFSYKGLRAENPEILDDLYTRRVLAVNSTVREDQEIFFGEGKEEGGQVVMQEESLGPWTIKMDDKHVSPFLSSESSSSESSFGRNDNDIIMSVRAFLGRGPGKTKNELLIGGGSGTEGMK